MSDQLRARQESLAGSTSGVTATLSSTALPVDAGLPVNTSLPTGGAATKLRSSSLGHLTPTEWRRRLTHILPGLLPIVLWFKYHRDPLSLDCRAWLGAVIVGIGIATAVKYRRRARRGATSHPPAHLGYTIPVFFLLMFVPAKAELGLATLAIISFGDGFATLGGLLLKGPALPWNRDKSWAGFLCFLVFAAPWSATVYWAESNPAVFFAPAFAAGLLATFIAAVAESVRSRIDDNIRVGLAAAGGMLLSQTIFFGW
jgi:dolichol kinase